MKRITLWINYYFIAENLTQLPRHIFRFQVGVPEQHPGIPMTADKGYFGNAQPALKEAAYRLVAKIVEA